MRLVRNLSIVSLGLGTSRVLYFAAILIVARLLGVDAFGRYIEGFAFVGLFVNLMDFGLSPLVTRELSANFPSAKIGSYVGNVFIGKLVPVVISLVIVISAGYFAFLDNDLFGLILIFAIGFAANSFRALLDAVYYGLDKPVYPSLFAITQRVLFLLVVPILIIVRSSPLTAAGWYAVSSSAAFLVAFWTTDRQLDVLENLAMPKSETWMWIRSLLREGFGLAILGIITSAYVRVDIVILGRLAGNNAAGIYGAAYRIFDIFLFVGLIYRTVVYPIAGELSTRDNEKLKLLISETIRLAAIIVLPMATILAIFAPTLTDLILGVEYLDSVRVLTILAAAMPFALLNNTLLFVLLALRDDSAAIKIALLGLVTNVALNFLLIPVYGARGPALVTVVTEALVTFLLFIRISQRSQLELAAVARPRLLISVLVPLLVLGLLLTRRLDPVFVGVVYLSTLLVLIWQLGVLNSTERSAMKRVLRQAKGVINATMRGQWNE